MTPVFDTVLLRQTSELNFVEEQPERGKCQAKEGGLSNLYSYGIQFDSTMKSLRAGSMTAKKAASGTIPVQFL